MSNDTIKKNPLINVVGGFFAMVFSATRNAVLSMFLEVGVCGSHFSSDAGSMGLLFLCSAA